MESELIWKGHELWEKYTKMQLWKIYKNAAVSYVALLSLENPVRVGGEVLCSNKNSYRATIQCLGYPRIYHPVSY